MEAGHHISSHAAGSDLMDNDRSCMIMSVLARTCNANQIKLACPFKLDATVWLLCLSGLTHESHGHSPETVYLSFGFETHLASSRIISHHLASSRHLISRHKPSQPVAKR